MIKRWEPKKVIYTGAKETLDKYVKQGYIKRVVADKNGYPRWRKVKIRNAEVIRSQVGIYELHGELEVCQGHAPGLGGSSRLELAEDPDGLGADEKKGRCEKWDNTT